MKAKVTKVRLVLELDVVRGRRWHELAPFREAVLFHFTPAALREKVVVLSEAVADQILEEVTDATGFDEPEFRAYLRAVIADLRHSRLSLQEVVSSYAEEMEAPKDREVSLLSLRLAEQLEKALAEIEALIGPAPP